MRNETAGKITDAELTVIELLWQRNAPMTAAQIKTALMQTTDWNGDTIKTLLRRLCAKGAVAQDKREVFYYRPTISAGQYRDYRTRELVDRLYKGKVKNLVAAMIQDEQLDEEDLASLRAMFRAGGFDD